MLNVNYSSDDDRREKIRINYETQIIIESGAAEIQMNGNSRDLSLGGVYVDTDQRLPLTTPCKVKIRLSGMIPPLFLEIDGRIVRTDEAGIAVAFESMDLDSYTHLKNIVRYNVANPDGVF